MGRQGPCTGHHAQSHLSQRKTEWAGRNTWQHRAREESGRSRRHDAIDTGALPHLLPGPLGKAPPQSSVPWHSTGGSKVHVLPLACVGAENLRGSRKPLQQSPRCHEELRGSECRGTAWSEVSLHTGLMTGGKAVHWFHPVSTSLTQRGLPQNRAGSDSTLTVDVCSVMGPPASLAVYGTPVLSCPAPDTDPCHSTTCSNSLAA